MKIYIEIPEGLSYPSIAVIPFSEGEVTRLQLKNEWQLCQCDVPIDSFKEIVALWPGPGETVKWVHVHGIFEGGKDYSFDKAPPPVIGPLHTIPQDSDLDWEVQVEDDRGSIWKNTAFDRTTLQVISNQDYGLGLIDDNGAWRHPNSSTENKFEEIHNNNFLRITRYEGWLKNGENSIFRYCTRVTRYANNPLTKISQTVIFAGKMRGKKIKHISFVINNPRPFPINTTSGINGTHYHHILARNNDYVSVHQRRIDRCDRSTPYGNVQVSGKSDGYITKDDETLLVRDFWQKFPQALECNHNSTTYRQWYGGEDLEPIFDGPVTIDGVTAKERLQDQNIHKLMGWHQGPYLVNDIPKTNSLGNPEWADKLYERIDPPSGNQGDIEEGGPVEEFKEYTDHADMQGISIHDDIVISKQHYQMPAMAALWNANPVGSCDPSYIESTKISDFGARKTDFSNVEEFLEDSILSYTDPARFEDYGRFLYGESHRNIFVCLNRPSRHRIGLASYYCAGETYWRMRLRGGSNDILQLARMNTERYRSIVQVSYDELKGVNRPDRFWSWPGGFWYRGLWWGSLVADDGGHGGWNTHVDRIPDPDSLLWSWILDGNRYHKEGYELWYKRAKDDIKGITSGVVRTSAARLLNKMLVYAITAHDYYCYHPIAKFRLTKDANNVELKDRILTIGRNLMQIRLDADEIDGPLFHPEWLKVFVEFLIRYYPQDEPFIVQVLDFAIANYNSNFRQEQKTLDMATLLIDMSLGKYANYPTQPIPEIRINDHLDWISRMTEKIYKGFETKWYNFGVGDGELGDAWLKLQWGAFVKRIRMLRRNEPLPEYNFHGHYPCSSNYGGRGATKPSTAHVARGNEYQIFKHGTETLKLKFKFTPKQMNSKSGFSSAEIWLVSPSNKPSDPAIRIHANKFMSLFLDHQENDVYVPVTDINYPTNFMFPPGSQHECTLTELRDLRDQLDPAKSRFFDAFSRPNNLHKFRWNWERSDPFMTENGDEDYTFLDHFDNEDSIPGSESGFYRLYINGKSVYPGLTENNLPEVMVLTAYEYEQAETDSGDYMFTDSIFYLKNIGVSPVTMTFWASVLANVDENSHSNAKGSFARIKKMDPDFPANTLESHDLMYNGTGYGDLSSRVSFVIPGGSMILLKTILIYNITLVRAKLTGDSQNGRMKLLCARSKNDLEHWGAAYQVNNHRTD